MNWLAWQKPFTDGGIFSNRRKLATVDPIDPLEVMGNLTDGQWGAAYSDALTVSGGTGPYAIAGLPAGLSAEIVDGVITITGTPV